MCGALGLRWNARTAPETESFPHAMGKAYLRGRMNTVNVSPANDHLAGASRTIGSPSRMMVACWTAECWRGRWMMAQVVQKVDAETVGARIRATPGQIAAFCRAHHIRWLALFGSVLRDDFRADSDIDVLIEFDTEHPVTFFDLHEMQEELSRLFGGRSVDLVTHASLYWRMRGRVLRSMIVLYGDAPEIPDAVVPEVSTPKDDRVYVGIMWDMVHTMGDAVRGKTRADYDADAALRYALAGALRRFSARSAQVSGAFRETHAEIPWHKTDTMYRTVSEDGVVVNEGMLWEIAACAMPALIPALEPILPPELRYPPDEPFRGVNG